ncbi:MAG: family 43 glycosylhydrolase [Paludibacteraceae bacterium]|nr:family 43 glycosylhydrolase [Paludibacteraceae bacterium]
MARHSFPFNLPLIGISLLAACITQAANPFLPLWEYIPDGEPYVFEDPDNPGHYRVYLYGSHDSNITSYCGQELVVWSAPVDSLTHWRYDGEILCVNRNAKGQLLYPATADSTDQSINTSATDGTPQTGEESTLSTLSSRKGDVLYAPDICCKRENDGTLTYYLYPNDQEWGRQTLIARAKRPDGPFTVYNWNSFRANETVGDLRFDPAVFIDDDGRVYGYWGFDRSYGAELDPTTMATILPGTQPIEDMISSRHQEGPFRFFEASSIRKIEGKYVFIYSRWTANGENGLADTNYTLAYAYSDHPLGPWTYGGTIIDCRGRDTDLNNKPCATATITGNTHGSICQINGQWYVFYHRQTGTDEFSRQAMVSPIDVQVTADGKVHISEAEYTSEGFETNGLNPYREYSAGIACYYTGPSSMQKAYPRMLYSGSYPSGERGALSPMVNNVDGSVVGYKYYNFDQLTSGKQMLRLTMTTFDIPGRITIMLDSPYKQRGGKVIGSYDIAKCNSSVVSIPLTSLRSYKGKHAIYLLFSSPTSEQSICTLHTLQFVAK